MSAVVRNRGDSCLAPRRRNDEYCAMARIRRAIILQQSGLGVVAAVLFVVSRRFPLVDELADVQQHVMRWGVWSAIWYPVLYACCNVLLLPGGVLSVGAGFFFGLWWGFAF